MGAFGSWASAYQGWLGTEHLSALLQLTGSTSFVYCPQAA